MAWSRDSEGIDPRVECYQTAIMKSILVRGVPDDVHDVLARRAESQGQSLQQYLVRELVRLAEQPTLDEVLDRIDRRRGGRMSLSAAVDAVRRGREER